MRSKSTVTFDKLDKKCYEDLNIIIDVLTSTLNKIGALFSIYHDDILTIVKKELKFKRGWRVSSEDKQLFNPFMERNIRNLTQLQPYFAAGNEIAIVKKHGINIKNKFYIYAGLHYAIDEDGIEKCLYFSICRHNNYLKKYGIMYQQNIYKKMLKNLKGLDYELMHPDDEYDYEEIYLWCDELDVDKLNDYFERFKTDIVIPYIRNLD